MNDALVTGAPPGAPRGYRDTVFLPQTQFPMPGTPWAISRNRTAGAVQAA
jgi:hypothetical protein